MDERGVPIDDAIVSWKLQSRMMATPMKKEGLYQAVVHHVKFQCVKHKGSSSNGDRGPL